MLPRLAMFFKNLVTYMAERLNSHKVVFQLPYTNDGKFVPTHTHTINTIQRKMSTFVET